VKPVTGHADGDQAAAPNGGESWHIRLCHFCEVPTGTEIVRTSVAVDNRPIRLKHYLHRRDLPARPTDVCSLGNDVTQSRDARLSPRHFFGQVVQPQ
jgi:hypothetical protein